MDKKLQDLAWSCLPKEFKEEVKKEWRRAYYNDTKVILEYFFGIHNLTSDAEEEEMLTCEKSKALSRLQYAKDGVEENPAYYNGYAQAIYDLFGSKCLPDEHKECSNPSVVNCRHKHGDGSCSLDGMCYYKSPNLQEPKPAEPKFKVGDKVIYKKTNKQMVVNQCAEFKDYDDVYLISTFDGRYPKWVKESGLEPYTEPEEETSPNVNNSDIDIDELVAKGYVLDPAKQFANILKDSFSKERRLNIAAMAMQGMLTRIDDTPQVIADAAFRYADALIDECKKKK